MRLSVTLKSAKKRDNFYQDKKYVKTACGAVYNGVLLALDCFFMLKDVKGSKKDRRSILYYRANVAKLDKKLLDTLNSAYEILHLWGYYDGITRADVVKASLHHHRKDKAVTGY